MENIIDAKKWVNRFTLHVFLSLLISFVGMIVGMLFLPPAAGYICSIILLVGLIITSIFKQDKSISMKFGYLFFFLDGIAMYPVISYYIGVNGALYVLAIFLITLIITGLLAGYGYMTKKDIASWGGVLFVALLGIILMSIVNIFLNSTMMTTVISIAGVVIFSLYIIYDVWRVKKVINLGLIREDNDLTWHVINVYLDIVNLFLYILRLFSRK